MRLVSFILILFSSTCLAQWSNLKGGLDAQGRFLLYDSTSNSVIVSGNFYHADTLLANHIASWDGQNWSVFGSGAPEGAPGYSMIKFQNELFLSSVFGPAVRPNWLAKWSGTNWDTISPNVAGAIHRFYEYGNELYIGGTFKSIGSDTARLIAKYNGSTFTSFPLPCDWGSVIAIEYFQGQMYIGGNFYDTISQTNDLEYFDGNTFLPFGTGGLSFGSDYVNAFAIFNNELYIGGAFSTSTGSVGENIMRWNGTSMSPVGSGLNGYVFRMKTYPDGLYVCGVFDMAGSLPVSGIAKWNGNQWSEVIPYIGPVPIIDFLVLNNEIYITGSFGTIDTIQMNNIAKYSFPTNIEENIGATIKIYPNPSSDFVTIELPGINQININNVTVVNYIGERMNLIYEENKEVIRIEISNYSAGVYFLNVKSEKLNSTLRFIKL